jgi:hypothetical protein
MNKDITVNRTKQKVPLFYRAIGLIVPRHPAKAQKYIKFFSQTILAIIVLICIPSATLSDGGTRSKESKLRMKENIDETQRWKDYYEFIGGDEGWKLKKDKNGVKVYARQTPVSPLNAFKGVVNVKANFDDLVAFASDPYAYPEYIYLCTSAEVLKFQNENDTYLRSVNKAPWPVSVRDTITHTVWRKDPETGAVIMDCIGVPELIPEHKGYVRTPIVYMCVVITPKENGIHEIVFEGVVEPGGWIPDIIANFCVAWTPYKTLLNVKTKRPFEQEQYINKKIKFSDGNPYIKMSLSENVSLPKAVE